MERAVWGAVLHRPPPAQRCVLGIRGHHTGALAGARLLLFVVLLVPVLGLADASRHSPVPVRSLKPEAPVARALLGTSVRSIAQDAMHLTTPKRVRIKLKRRTLADTATVSTVHREDAPAPESELIHRLVNLLRNMYSTTHPETNTHPPPPAENEEFMADSDLYDLHGNNNAVPGADSSYLASPPPITTALPPSDNQTRPPDPRGFQIILRNVGSGNTILINNPIFFGGADMAGDNNTVVNHYNVQHGAPPMEVHSRNASEEAHGKGDVIWKGQNGDESEESFYNPKDEIQRASKKASPYGIATTPHPAHPAIRISHSEAASPSPGLAQDDNTAPVDDRVSPPSEDSEMDADYPPTDVTPEAISDATLHIGEANHSECTDCNQGKVSRAGRKGAPVTRRPNAKASRVVGRWVVGRSSAPPRRPRGSGRGGATPHSEEEHAGEQKDLASTLSKMPVGFFISNGHNDSIVISNIGAEMPGIGTVPVRVRFSNKVLNGKPPTTENWSKFMVLLSKMRLVYMPMHGNRTDSSEPMVEIYETDLSAGAPELSAMTPAELSDDSAHRSTASHAEEKTPVSSETSSHHSSRAGVSRGASLPVTATTSEYVGVPDTTRSPLTSPTGRASSTGTPHVTASVSAQPSSATVADGSAGTTAEITKKVTMEVGVSSVSRTSTHSTHSQQTVSQIMSSTVSDYSTSTEAPKKTTSDTTTPVTLRSSSNIAHITSATVSTQTPQSTLDTSSTSVMETPKKANLDIGASSIPRATTNPSHNVTSSSSQSAFSNLETSVGIGETTKKASQDGGASTTARAHTQGPNSTQPTTSPALEIVTGTAETPKKLMFDIGASPVPRTPTYHTHNPTPITYSTVLDSSATSVDQAKKNSVEAGTPPPLRASHSSTQQSASSGSPSPWEAPTSTQAPPEHRLVGSISEVSGSETRPAKLKLDRSIVQTPGSLTSVVTTPETLSSTLHHSGQSPGVTEEGGRAAKDLPLQMKAGNLGQLLKQLSMLINLNSTLLEVKNGTKQGSGSGHNGTTMEPQSKQKSAKQGKSDISPRSALTLTEEEATTDESTSGRHNSTARTSGVSVKRAGPRRGSRRRQREDSASTRAIKGSHHTPTPAGIENTDHAEDAHEKVTTPRDITVSKSSNNKTTTEEKLDAGSGTVTEAAVEKEAVDTQNSTVNPSREEREGETITQSVNESSSDTAAQDTALYDTALSDVGDPSSTVHALSDGWSSVSREPSDWQTNPDNDSSVRTLSHLTDDRLNRTGSLHVKASTEVASRTSSQAQISTTKINAGSNNRTETTSHRSKWKAFTSSHANSIKTEQAESQQTRKPARVNTTEPSTPSKWYAKIKAVISDATRGLLSSSPPNLEEQHPVTNKTRNTS